MNYNMNYKLIPITLFGGLHNNKKIYIQADPQNMPTHIHVSLPTEPEIVLVYKEDNGTFYIPNPNPPPVETTYEVYAQYPTKPNAYTYFYNIRTNQAKT